MYVVLVLSCMLSMAQICPCVKVGKNTGLEKYQSETYLIPENQQPARPLAVISIMETSLWPDKQHTTTLIDVNLALLLQVAQPMMCYVLTNMRERSCPIALLLVDELSRGEPQLWKDIDCEGRSPFCLSVRYARCAVM